MRKNLIIVQKFRLLWNIFDYFRKNPIILEKIRLITPKSDYFTKNPRYVELAGTISKIISATCRIFRLGKF
jgi:hypothetical protein